MFNFFAYLPQHHWHLLHLKKSQNMSNTTSVENIHTSPLLYKHDHFYRRYMWVNQNILTECHLFSKTVSSTDYVPKVSPCSPKQFWTTVWKYAWCFTGKMENVPLINAAWPFFIAFCLATKFLYASVCWYTSSSFMYRSLSFSASSK